MIAFYLPARESNVSRLPVAVSICRLMIVFRSNLNRLMANFMLEKIDKIARAIKAAHEGGETFANLAGDVAPDDVAQAYAAQDRLHALHAEAGRGVLGGRKIALASKVQQELCGIDHPIAGGIFAGEIMATPASVKLSDYQGLGIEFEMAVRLGKDLTVEDGPYNAENIRGAIASVHPAFELIIDRGADYTNLGALTMIADNAWCAGVVLGPEIAGWQDLDLNELPATLYWNDFAPISAKTGDADPLGSLAWVANLVTSMGNTMRAGEIVITGSVIKTRYPGAGEHFRYDIAGLGDVSLTII